MRPMTVNDATQFELPPTHDALMMSVVIACMLQRLNIQARVKELVESGGDRADIEVRMNSSKLEHFLANHAGVDPNSVSALMHMVLSIACSLTWDNTTLFDNAPRFKATFEECAREIERNGVYVGRTRKDN